MNLSGTFITTMAIPMAIATAAADAHVGGTSVSKSTKRTDALLRHTAPATEIKLDAPSADSAGSPIESLRQRTLEYGAFEDGWDGEGSRGANQVATAAALQLIDVLPGGLPLPGVTISMDGELAFYWDLPGGYAEISFMQSDRAAFFARTHAGAEKYADELELSGFTRAWFFNELGAMAAPQLAAA